MFLGLSVVFIEGGKMIRDRGGDLLTSLLSIKIIMRISDIIRAILDPFRRKDDSIFK